MLILSVKTSLKVTKIILHKIVFKTNSVKIFIILKTINSLSYYDCIRLVVKIIKVENNVKMSNL